MPEKLGLKLDALGLRKAQHIIAVSNYTKTDLMYRLNIPESKITVIHNGVNRNIFKPLAKRPFHFPLLLTIHRPAPF